MAIQEVHVDALVWKGFNTDASANRVLGKIVAIYAKIRLGMIPRKLDELGAAVEAIIMDALSNSKSPVKEINGNKAPANKDWMLPVIHALDLHIKHLTCITPIAFSNMASKDSKIRKSHCMFNTAVVILNVIVTAGIERR